MTLRWLERMDVFYRCLLHYDTDSHWACLRVPKTGRLSVHLRRRRHSAPVQRLPTVGSRPGGQWPRLVAPAVMLRTVSVS